MKKTLIVIITIISMFSMTLYVNAEDMNKSLVKNRARATEESRETVGGKMYIYKSQRDVKKELQQQQRSRNNEINIGSPTIDNNTKIRGAEIFVDGGNININNRKNDVNIGSPKVLGNNGLKQINTQVEINSLNVNNNQDINVNIGTPTVSNPGSGLEINSNAKIHSIDVSGNRGGLETNIGGANISTPTAIKNITTSVTVDGEIKVKDGATLNVGTINIGKTKDEEIDKNNRNGRNTNYTTQQFPPVAAPVVPATTTTNNNIIQQIKPLPTNSNITLKEQNQSGLSEIPIGTGTTNGGIDPTTGKRIGNSVYFDDSLIPTTQQLKRHKEESRINEELFKKFKSIVDTVNLSIDIADRYHKGLDEALEEINIISKYIDKLDIQIRQDESASFSKSKSKTYYPNKFAKNQALKTLDKSVEVMKGLRSDLYNLKLEKSSKIFLSALGEIDLKQIKNWNSLENWKQGCFDKISDLYPSTSNSKAIKAIAALGLIGTAIDIGIDVSEWSKRVEDGSTNTLESLNLFLKSVEVFQPTIPFTKTPSDVGRAMIEWQSALKQRNKSLLASNDTAINGAASFIHGDASIEKYIERRSGDNDFMERVQTVGITNAYNELRAEYMKNHFSNYVKLLYDTKSFLEKEKDSAWLSDSKKMYDSFIAGIDMSIKNMTEKSGDIWSNNRGFDIAKAIYEKNTALTKAKNKYNELKRLSDDFSLQSAELSSSINKLQEDAVQLQKNIDEEKNIANDNPQTSDGGLAKGQNPDNSSIGIQPNKILP
ncbi:MAG: hypothetical protein HQK72_05090 [Desulfamplus sp.]|nr:hypothetical protein [Desulfamplus sp.]